MKLQNKKKKIIPIIIIAIVTVLIIAAIVAVVIIKNPNGLGKGNEVTGIVISSIPDNEYFVGERIDLTGLKIQVLTGDPTKTYFVQYPNADLKISGFDSSVANESLPVTVTYKGFSTTFNVKIIDYPPEAPTVVSIRLSDNFYDFTYTVDFWNTYGLIWDGVKLILTYSDGTEKEVPMKSKYCSDVVQRVESAGTTQFYITYPDELMADGRAPRCTVTVTITN